MKAFSQKGDVVERYKFKISLDKLINNCYMSACQKKLEIFNVAS